MKIKGINVSQVLSKFWYILKAHLIFTRKDRISQKTKPRRYSILNSGELSARKAPLVFGEITNLWPVYILYPDAFCLAKH